ncbi:hypothetical protein DWF00_09080 [Bosea caraganae]|uniref:Uncharacterized protein n=1 Tax=Bosea caraganae TaxID=2763117 RepID=A0A370LB18_9HYPH|nr:hypothetical protein [Bosea caraganae]RDJ27145.1 hypothetical protein DWF00_09080 [Bosea caraganae]RDJ29162.1 hypothetical protein DWE98_00855 [Bosea caraganae]
MDTATLNLLTLGLGVVGFACLAWPIIMRVSGRAPAPEPGSTATIRSPLWWLGFTLTVIAIVLQRVASQQAGGG